MAIKANRLKSEGTEPAPDAGKKSVNGADKSAKSGVPKTPSSSFLDIFRSERFVRITGLFLLLFSLFLLFSFVSHFFNWRHDFDKVSDVPWFDLMSDNKSEVSNRMGEIGALMAYFFIHQWFGISALLIPFYTFLVAFRMFFNITLLPMWKTFTYSLFSLIFISVTCALLFSEDLMYGGFGFHLYDYMRSIIGVPGVVLILVFSLMVFLMLAFNFNFRIPEKSSTDVDHSVEETPQAAAGNKLRSGLFGRKQQLDEIEEEPLEEENDDLEEDTSEESLEEEPWSDEIPQAIELVTTGKAISSAAHAGAMPTLEINMPDLPDEPEEELIAPVSNEPITLSEPVPLSEEDKERMNLTEVLGENQEFDIAEYDPTLDLSSYRYPEPDLLENHGSNKAKVDKAELEANSNRIIETLKSYNIEIAKISASVGPTVTLYEIIPAAGVRISKIKNLEDDIALSLSALGIRIIAPMPGKGTIGIEVPNQNPEIVAMKTLIMSEKFMNTTMDLPVALGKTISNENFVADLAKMPHLLMAGATGQGKSVGLNAILVSLLYKKHPSQIKFVLVDPKKVELTLFNKIERHFLAKLPNNEDAIITDVKKVVYTLNSLCVLMDQRYELLKMAMVRNIKEYNAKFQSRKLNPKLGHHYMPYIVLVVDEFADLIMTAGKEVELPIARLAQLARAIGIHLIIATQRPSVNIITGTIKANFPARIAFRVTSKIDSRTILDSGGADQLIGRGDLLFSTGSDLIRLQCPFVDTPEVDKICDFIGNQRGYPSAFILPEYIDENADPEEDFDIGDRDSMFEDAAKIVVNHQQGSASLLQRKLKLGYNRAGRIIDQLEKAGIIGPFEGSKARKVLYSDITSLEQYLKGQNNDL
jgi:S-DNA-T family DNA segregation ATPase FtsK/SpoIIIE